MRKICSLIITALILMAFIAILPLPVFAAEPPVHMMVIEYQHGSGRATLNAIPPEDDSMSNPDFPLACYGKVLDKPKK